MTSETALGALVLACLVAVPVGVSWMRRRDARAVLDQIAMAVGGQRLGHEIVKCTRYSHELVLRRYRDGSKYFQITTAIPREYPLLLDIRRETYSDWRAKRRDDLVDVRVGDREFDEMFVVEGAPADVVARLVTKPLRELLVASSDARVVVDNTHELALKLDRWPDAETAIAAIDAIAVVAAEVPIAFSAIGHSAPAVETTGAPYRGALAEQPVEDLARVHNLELVELGERKRRRDRRLGVTGVVGLAFGIAMLVRCVLLFVK